MYSVIVSNHTVPLREMQTVTVDPSFGGELVSFHLQVKH
jgi:hypothetical protein